jgi:molybdopterin-guanine dinucleotide biosynthesis protein
MKDTAIVSVSGFSSEVGKTTLMCELLRAFPGWEAIKMTRGHYRSCGKDPHACCVSHMLSEEPVIRSGREHTYELGKDTGRYWDAGAANVHWVIVTDEQVEQGVRQALDRISAQGVFIEGNSFLDFIQVDFAVMVATASGGKIKASARRALSHTSALYLAPHVGCLRGDPALTSNGDEGNEEKEFAAWRKSSGLNELSGVLPIYTHATLPSLIAQIQGINSRITAGRTQLAESA